MNIILESEYVQILIIRDPIVSNEVVGKLCFLKYTPPYKKLKYNQYNQIVINQFKCHKDTVQLQASKDVPTRLSNDYQTNHTKPLVHNTKI